MMDNRKTHHWIKEEIEFVKTQCAANVQQKVIAFNVTQKFGFHCTPKMVRNVLDRNMEHLKKRGYAFAPPREKMNEKQISYTNKMSSMLHLLDLKRAGHSPTRTEYQIGSDGSLRREAPIYYSSSVGSPASLCAESV